MKEGWKYSTIGDLCDKINGLWKGKVGPFVNVGVIRNANFTKTFTLSFDNIEYLDVEAKQYKTRKLQKGDLIVEKSGGSEKQPVGRTVLFDKEDGEYSFSNFTSVLRIKDRIIISPEFLYKYILFVYLRGDTRKMQKATTGIHNIEFDKFLAIPVPKLTLSEQQRIVDYLDSAFAKIDAMKANAEKSLNEAKALFQASLKEMLEPKEGWEEKKLEDITEVKDGTHDSPKYVTEGIPFVTQKNITISGFDLLNTKKITLEDHKKFYTRSNVEFGDIIIAMIGANRGMSCIVDTREIFSIKNVGLIKKNDNINMRYLLFYLHSPSANTYILNNSNGGAQEFIGLKGLRTFPMPYPPLSEQQRIVETLDTLKSKVDRLQANFDKVTQECDALKQAILRQVFE